MWQGKKCAADLCFCDVIKVLPDNLFHCVKRQAHNHGGLVICCSGEDHEHGLPARLDIGYPRQHHL